jgi:hypothetical protein
LACFPQQTDCASFGAHSPASLNQITGYPSSPADNVTSHLTPSSNGRILK